jgi:hypothetical protein
LSTNGVVGAVAGSAAAVLPLAGVAVPLAAGAAVVAADAGLLTAGAGVAAIVAVLLVAAGWAVLPLLSWLHAASASRAAHRSGRRLNMATSQSVEREIDGADLGRRSIDQGVAAAGWPSVPCRPSM